MKDDKLIKEIYWELIKGEGRGRFSNHYLNRVIDATNLIERERPELKEEFGQTMRCDY